MGKKGAVFRRLRQWNMLEIAARQSNTTRNHVRAANSTFGIDINASKYPSM